MATKSEFRPYCEIFFSNQAADRGAPDETFSIKAPDDYDFKAVVASDRGGSDGSLKPKTADVTLYNLSRETLSRIRRGTLIQIRMGYVDGEFATVHNGTVHYVDGGDFDGADVSTVLYTRDITNLMRSIAIKATFVGSYIEDIVRDLLSAARIPIGSIDDTGVRLVRFVSGTLSVEQDLKTLARHAAATTREAWRVHFRDGQTQFIRESTGFHTAILLAPETGLIQNEPDLSETDTPDSLDTKVQAFDRVGNRQGVAAADIVNQRPLTGRRIVSTLKPTIVPDAIVYVRALRRPSGFYRVQNCEHTFDSAGESKTVCVVVPQARLDERAIFPDQVVA